ncbi:MAG: RecB family exonuclease [Pirellulaceae bacterium]
MRLVLPTIATTPPDTARPNGVWDYISASRLNLWLRCPLAFRLRYIDGIVTPPTASLFLGQQVHAGLEQYYRHRQLGVTLTADEIVRRLLADWQEAAATAAVFFAHPAEDADTRAQTVRLIRMYLEQVSPDEPLPLAVETSLEGPLTDPETGADLGIPLLGVVDLVLDSPAGAVVVDFKTAAKANHPVEILHEVQLTTYSWLFRQAAGQHEAGLEIRSLVKTKRPKFETHRYPPRTEQHVRRLFRLLRVYLDDLDAGQFCYRPGFHCLLCEYRRECAGWHG